jgi:hypothetical protein
MSLDPTAVIYNSFYAVQPELNASKYEIVLSFFKNYCEDDATAESFALFLFKISELSDVDVLELLDTFQGDTEMQISATMAYYLNTLNRNKIILYGIDNILGPIMSVQRNIVE